MGNEKSAGIKWRLEYDKLWLKFKDKEFNFEEALEVIFGNKKFSSREIKYGSKLINVIENNAFAIQKRADYDQRVRLYRLLNPEKVSNARAVYNKVYGNEKFSISYLAEEANRSANWDYLYIKDTAIWFLTNQYRSSNVKHTSVLEENVDGWISLFKMAGLSVIENNEIVSEQLGVAETVSLYTDLSTREHKKGKNHIQNSEYTIIEAFEDSDLLGALAVLIVQKNKIDWDELLNITKTSGLINTLGFSLECINFEANKEIFSPRLINRIKKYKRKELETIKGVEKILETNLSYKSLEEKWNVKCYQAPVFSKVVLDLVR